MHEPDTALYIVQGMPGKRPPGSLDCQKTKTSPCIDSDTAVLEISDNVVPLVGELPFGLRMNDDVGAERTVQVFITVRILEGLWELSVQQHGRVTEEYSRETTRAVSAYMRLYWPEYLDRKGPEAVNVDDATRNDQ